MLDKLPAWLRHVVIGAVYSLLTILLPVLVDHQEDLRDWIVGNAHLPLILAPVVAGVIAQAILYFTNVTKQYGTGSTTPPVVPVIDPQAEAVVGDDPAVGGNMAGYAMVELVLGVLLIVFLVLLILRLA